MRKLIEFKVTAGIAERMDPKGWDKFEALSPLLGISLEMVGAFGTIVARLLYKDRELFCVSKTHNGWLYPVVLWLGTQASIYVV